MKTKIPYALLGAILSVSAPAATTTPVGYNTVEFSPGIFNLTGLTLQEPTVASGTIESVGSSSITDDDADFTTLESDAVYILEITSGPGAGIIQEFDSPSATSISTPEDISGQVSAGATYSVRRAATINSVFGPDNGEAELMESTDGSAEGADLVLTPNMDGTFDTYFFLRLPGTFVGWTDGDSPAGDVVLNYADGVFVRTRAASTAEELVVTGEVKTGTTSSILQPGFNLVNSVAPAGLTLGNSGLEDSVTASTDGTTTNADLVLIPSTDNPGTFDTYYYLNIPGSFVGWTDGDADASDVALDGAFFLRNRGEAKSYSINGPTIANQ